MLPQKLARLIEGIETLTDRTERIEALISIAGKFQPVPHTVAVKPHPEENRVPACESEAFVWALENPDGTMNLYFDVLNPQGVSAKALAAILESTLSGSSAEEIAQVTDDVVFRIFGNELSMGKTMGLTAMLGMVRAAAKRSAKLKAE